MGFYPIPPVPAYGAGCLLAFPPGKTPSEFLASFNGISYCDALWPPGLPRPKETWILKQVTGEYCHWYDSDDNFECSLEFAYGPATAIHLVHRDLESVFSANVSGIKFGAENQNPFCDGHFWIGVGGSCAMMPKSETSGPCLQTLCSRLSLPIDTKTKLDIIADSATHFGVHFHRRETGVECLVKFAYADFP